MITWKRARANKYGSAPKKIVFNTRQHPALVAAIKALAAEESERTGQTISQNMIVTTLLLNYKPLAQKFKQYQEQESYARNQTKPQGNIKTSS